MSSLLRKCIRELLAENVIALGMCFPFAIQKAEEWWEQHYTPPDDPDNHGEKHPDLNNMDKFKIVHGKVTDQWKKPPKPIVHAWVEMGDLVFDDQTRITKPGGVPKDVYYDMFQPQVVAEYTAEQALNKCSLSGYEGPWDSGLVGTMRQRDAWLKDHYLRGYIKELLYEGRYESETTQISRAIVNWVKDKLAEGLPQDEVPKYKRSHPFHDLGIRMFDVPSTLKGQLNRLTATIKVDPDPNMMQDTFEVAGKAGVSTRGSKDMQVQIYLRSDFNLQDMNDFIADLKETIIHELEHTGQSEELKDTAEPHTDRGYDWNKLDGLRNYYSSQSEMEAYAKGAYKKAKVKGITYPEAIDEVLNSSMETFIRRYEAHADAGATDRLDYNEQDIRDYFQVELRDQILDIARKKYPAAKGAL